MGILTFGLLFWGWPFTFGMHRYDCLTEGGLTINQTLEQWKDNNLGIAEPLVPMKTFESTRTEQSALYAMNLRFGREFSRHRRLMGIVEREERVIDLETGEVVLHYVYFDSALRNPIVRGARGIRDYKAWLSLGMERCEWGQRKEHM